MSLFRVSRSAGLRAFQRSAVVSARPSMLGSVRFYADQPDGEFSQTFQRGNTSKLEKREQANEDQYVRQQEQEKLKALREKLAQHQKDLDELEGSIKSLKGNSK